LSNGKVATYIAGTTTAYNTLKDWNSTYNGVVFDLDIRGGCSMIWPTTQLIKIIVKDVDGNIFKTLDNIGSGTAEDPITVFPDVSDNQNIWYLDTVNGLDTNSGLSRSAPKKTGDAVVIACKTAGKSAGRLVVMAGSSGVVFNATTWSNTAFPFFDVVVESFFSTIEFISAMPTDLNFRGGIVTFSSCQIGGDSCIDARKIELNGGGCYSLYDSQIILRGSESIKTNGFIAQNTTFESPLLTIDALGLRNRCNIHCGKINGTGTIFNSNNEVLYLDLYADLFAFEGEFQFPSQLGNSWIKITAAKMQRTATRAFLYLGAVANVTVNYQIIVDTMGSIVPLQIRNPAGTVAGKVIELLKYENKVDAEIIRATAAEALKANKLTTVNNSTSTAYTFVAADVLTSHVVNSATAATRTVPSDATAPTISIGDSIEIVQLGAGQVTLVADTDVTILTSLTLKTYGQNSVIAIRKTAANTWLCMGERAVV